MKQAQRGLTFVEVGAALTILATAATLALPGFAEVLQRRHVEGVAGELATDLQYLRSEAVARNQSLRASFIASPDGASCYVLHSGGAGDCQCQPEAPPRCAAGALALKGVLLPAGSRSSIRANVGSIVYDPRHGTSSPAATVRVIGSDGRAIHHVVNVMGRVRSCSPGGAIGGYREC